LFDPTSFLSHKQADRVSAGLRGTRFTGGQGAHTGITAALSGSQPASYIRGPAIKGQVQGRKSLLDLAYLEDRRRSGG